jgi:hypothetical protein
MSRAACCVLLLVVVVVLVVTLPLASRGRIAASFPLSALTTVLWLCITLLQGYHLGQHRMPPGKREAFQHDINVALIVSGPGIVHGSTVDALAMNVDLPVTWAELGAASPDAAAPVVDGRSLASLMRNVTAIAAAEAWPRVYTLQEGYQSCEQGNGEGKACEKKPPLPLTALPARHVSVAALPPSESAAVAAVAAVAAGAKARDYSALRLKDGRDALYVEYVDGGKMYFDSAGDPWQTKNVFEALPAATKAELAAKLAAIKDCKGAQCP